ncbi:MAG TPA: hypothetical protein VF518_06185, partial [Polyangia bacterium]
WLDTAADDGLNIVLFTCIGLGVFRATGHPLALFAGILASGLHLVYDVIAYRELWLQRAGGEIIKVRWHLMGSSDMKTRLNTSKRDLVSHLHNLGRRDFFILAFLVYSLLGIPWLALIHALCIAGTVGVVAGAQVVWRFRGGKQSESTS